MGKKKLNTGLFTKPAKAVWSYATHDAYTAFVSLAGATIVGIIGFAGYDFIINEPKRQEIVAEQQEQRQIQQQAERSAEDAYNNFRTLEENGITYILHNSDIIHITDGAITHAFHFSSGEIYTEIPEGNPSTFRQDFDDVNRPKWIEEVRSASCELTQRMITAEPPPEIHQEDIQEKQFDAQNFLNNHCEQG